MPAPSTTAAKPSAASGDARPGRPLRRRAWWLVTAAVAVVLVAAAGAVSFTVRRGPARLSAPTVSRRAPAPGSAPAAAPVPTVQCRYAAARSGTGTEAGAEPDDGTAPGTHAGVPPADAPSAGTVRVTLRTNQGAIDLVLDAAKAPCAVHSFAHLARAGFFTDSPCHRLTTAGIFVLQCGDPTGSGSGGPGYRFADENLPVNITPAYPRGTVAMANAGPDTNGSQFFLVYRDSDIDPNYPVFGLVTGGLDIVERVAAGGAANNDGPPEIEVIVEGADVR
jgi:cyclophilin family peptidyl-prolyl cis-trans isomerase